jgi:hypothetical protein
MSLFIRETKGGHSLLQSRQHHTAILQILKGNCFVILCKMAKVTYTMAQVCARHLKYLQITGERAKWLKFVPNNCITCKMTEVCAKRLNYVQNDMCVPNDWITRKMTEVCATLLNYGQNDWGVCQITELSAKWLKLVPNDRITCKMTEACAQLLSYVKMI